jgi:cardiolipin synthase
MNKDFKKKILKKLRLLLRVVFSRTAVIAGSLLAQFLVLLAAIKWLSEYTTAIYATLILLGAVVVIHILNEENNASFKLSWMVPVLVIPIFGTMLYIYVNAQAGTKRLHKKLTIIEEELKPFTKQNSKILNELSDKSEGERGLAAYLYNADNYPVYGNCKVKYYPLGDDKFVDMVKRLKEAKKFIFLEYFIVTDGYMWETILEILKEKVAEGVEVRMMYDGMCSLALLPYGYYKKLEKIGIKSTPFSQIRPVLSTYQNNRDHRKILVIDGEVVFTGGVNLADEYINRIERFGHWKDTAVMIQGEAVKSFTLMFLKMWNVAMGNSNIPKEELERFVFCEQTWQLTDDKLHDGGYVIPYGDDPYGEERIGKQVYLDILNRAKKYVHIMTPYLILDDEMISALRYCAKRGVETVIMMPHIPDKVYAYLLARTYYKQLLKYGVKIYEYTPGFVHAKLFVSDDIRASLGTINLDFRSLYLHFECSAYIYENGVVCDIEKDYQETLLKCHEITLEDCKHYSGFKLAAGKILRLIAPLM